MTAFLPVAMRYVIVALFLSTLPSCSLLQDNRKTGGFSQTSTVSKPQQIEYEGFTLWIDCAKYGATKFSYVAKPDTGYLPRSNKFTFDPNLPTDCQQTNHKGYGHDYDRGHLVPANHLDHSKKAVWQSNFMTNILPQAANMNRGAWLLTEEITECYRDIESLQVIGGVIWGNNPSDDYFLQSHGVRTPDAFWKVVIRGVGQSQKAIAWIVPNSQAAKQDRLDQYLVSVAEIERVTGEKIPLAEGAKQFKLTHSWAMPKGCDKG